MSISEPVAGTFDWQSWIPTDVGSGWGGPQAEPPPEAGEDKWERWEAVRTAVNANTRHRLPVDQVRRLQQRLRPDGQMTSTCGEFDPRTVLSVMWYQRRRDLPVTGVLDDATLGALARDWPDLRRCSPRRLLPPRVLVPGGRSAVDRYCWYRHAILGQGGLFDTGHREVNVLVLRGAELRIDHAGLQVRSTGPRPADATSVTVSLWVERSDGEDRGDVTGIGLRERPGMVRPVPVRAARPIAGLGGGQYVCDIDHDGPTLPWAQAVVPRYSTDTRAIPSCRPEPPVATGVREPALVRTERMSYGRFFAELQAMRRERERCDGWRGVRVLTIDATRLDPG